MKKRLVLTTVFAMFFGCLVSFADVSPRGGKGPEKPKTVKVDNKRDNKKPAVKPAAKPAPKPVAHKPAPKSHHKPVAHKPNHKPAPKPAPVCHLNHHHNDHCHKDVVVVNPLNPVAVGAVTTAVTTAAVVGLVAALVN